MTTAKRDGLLLIGRILRAHGLRGAVEVQSFSGNPDEFRQYQELLLFSAAVERQKAILDERLEGELCRILQVRVKGRSAILELEGIKDRTAAERLVAVEVWVRKSDLPRPGQGEFYWHEVIGMSVMTQAGQCIGRVGSLFSTKAHDVLVVEGDCEVFIPAVEAFIRQIDYQNNTIIVDPPPGLLDVNG